ncbi:MAG: hypothetical protein ABSA92_08545 [Candidatus Bathyarchaeia archaeon]
MLPQSFVPKYACYPVAYPGSYWVPPSPSYCFPAYCYPPVYTPTPCYVEYCWPEVFYYPWVFVC